MLGMYGRKCKLWWSEKGTGVGGVGGMVKEKLCEKVLGVRMVSDDSCFLEGCAEVDLWVFSTKWKKSGRKAIFL